MNEIKLNSDLAKELEPLRPDEPTDAHRAWMDEQIKASLEKKRRGEMKLHDLDAVRREFGF